MTATTDLWPTPGCFDDVRILEVADERGEYCGMLLAGEGADVVKIEPPGGSRSRRIGPFYEDVNEPNRSLFFWNYNRGKRGIVLDFNLARDRDVYSELVKTADVIIDSEGPGVTDSATLGYDFAAKLNPDIIYCSITPFGLDGPWRDLKASDLIHLALGGTAYCCGYDQVEPGKWDTPPLVPQGWNAYYAVGEHAAMAIAAALVCRQMGGPGQFIDASIHEACCINTEGTLPRYIYNGHDQVRRLPTQILCGDGVYLDLIPIPPADLRRVAQVLANAGFNSDAEALANFDPAKASGLEGGAKIVAKIISGWAAVVPSIEAMQSLQECGMACAPVRTPENVVNDPHCVARDDFVEIEHPELGQSFTYVRHPRLQSMTPWRWGNRAPLIGEHGAEILQELRSRSATF